MNIGVLFSGIGGFEIVAESLGINAVWASEIAPAPIRITKRHFPNLQHVGDITKLSGKELEPVDIIAGSPPCQDLSVAGKQAGMNLVCKRCGAKAASDASTTCMHCGGEMQMSRSGLFYDYIRIIKEMREKTNGVYPKTAIYENVPGVLSSNHGDDFYSVLCGFAELIQCTIPVFRPKKWLSAGGVVGDKGSFSWRVLDAQYWGVPQRRRRIFIVANFGGIGFDEVLFERESLRWNYSQSTKERKETSGTTQTGIGTSSGDNQSTICFRLCSYESNSMKSSNPESGYYETNVSCTLDASRPDPSKNQGGLAIVQSGAFLAENSATARGIGYQDELCPTLKTANTPAVVIYPNPEIARTLLASGGCHRLDGSGENIVAIEYVPYGIHENQRAECRLTKDISPCLQGNGGRLGMGNPCILLEQNKSYVASFKYQQGAEMATLPYDEELSSTITAKQQIAVLIDNHGNDSRYEETDVCQPLCAHMGTGGNNTPLVIQYGTFTNSAFGAYDESGDVAATLCSCSGTAGGESETLISVNDQTQSIVRRLTPIECERLQGFPDNWTAGESDSARYAALGNSVALPCILYILNGVKNKLSIGEHRGDC